MSGIIHPPLFNGSINAFFSDKTLGLNVNSITNGQIYFPIQRHTDVVIVLEEDFTPAVADAVITARKNIMLGIKTADCVPILLFDKGINIIGAVHAGWRGTAKGILKKTIQTFTARFGSNPDNILVAMGPAIRGCCYEVGSDVHRAVHAETGDGHYYTYKNSNVLLDLQKANMLQALKAGVKKENVYIVEECTRCMHEKYYSYRHDTGTKGRQGGFVGLISGRGLHE